MRKKALIFGVTGQDGAYLTEFLLNKGYEVHGVKRRASSFNTQRVDHLFVDRHKKPNFYLHYGDLCESTGLVKIISEILPDEIYNLAAMSHVRLSFDIPEYTTDINATGTIRLLEALRINKLDEKTKFYQASTSELYGKVQEVPQSEETPFYPRSPYAAAKAYAFWITKNYREAYGLFACNGILFNHESPYRGETFVTRKITRAVAKIKLGFQDHIYLGNLDAKRDWGYAKEYVEGMWAMLQADRPDDYVLATGKTTKVREFVEYAFQAVGMSIRWEGETGSLDEQGVCEQTGKVLVKIDPQYFRPTEVDLLIGDPTKAKNDLGWEAQTSVQQLVQIMVEADLELMQRPSTVSVLEAARKMFLEQNQENSI